MLRDALVVLHAGSGVVGLIAGIWAIAPPAAGEERRWIRRLYVVCIGTLLASLVILILVDWTDLDTAARIAFTGLAGLGAVMAYRLIRALREAAVRSLGWRARYVGHVYFTYVSLWIGFVILPALNLPLPQVTAPLVAVAVLVFGNMLVNRYKRRVLSI